MMSGDALVDRRSIWAITGDTGQGTLMTFSPDPRKNRGRAAGGGGVQGPGLRPRGLHPLHLRRDPGLRRGGRQGGLDRSRRRSRRRCTATSFETVLGTIGFDDKGDVKGAEAT